MFCSSCGADVPSNAKFCPKCGAPNKSYGGAAKNASPGNAAEEVPVQGGGKATPHAAMNAAPSKTAIPGTGINRNMLVGMIGAVLAVFSLFLPFIKSSYFSVNLFDWMKEEYPSDGFTFYIIPIVGSILIVVFHLIKRPKLSIIGILALLFTFAVTFILFDSEGYERQGLSIGFGVWFLLVSIIVCLVAAFMKKRS